MKEDKSKKCYNHNANNNYNFIINDSYISINW